MTEGKVGEEFAGGTTADGGVVLQVGALLEDLFVAGSEPSEAQAGEAVGFAHGAEANGALVKIAAGGKTGGGIVFELAVDFIYEKINALAGGKLDKALKNGKRHEQSGGIVRGVDINGAGIGLN